MLRKCAVTLRPFGARAFSSEVSPQRAALVELAKAHRLSVPLIGAIFPAALAYIGEKIPGFLSSHTENSEHHFTKEDIEFGALYAFENILLSIAEGDSTHLTKVCHESIRPALSGVCKLVADGTLPVTLTYDEMIRPKVRIIQVRLITRNHTVSDSNHIKSSYRYHNCRIVLSYHFRSICDNRSKRINGIATQSLSL
eukprot:c5682_g1_i2.p1 GENE.c5682_g1_i2~~c5682_g1_i2.p1  ORF type:complete len:197 (+),score=38.49 c5682_g1_i2:39-629(+)